MEVIIMKNIINTTNAPAAIGPYSQAIEVNNMIYTSGVIPINPEDGTLVTGDIKVQAERVLKSLSALLEAAGTSMDQVIKTTVFIKNMDDFASMNEVYASYFTNNCPARSCVEVARLPKDVLIEIEAIAYR
jgi:2-iminobutanoate/2-iminopropanoate deaminase